MSGDLRLARQVRNLREQAGWTLGQLALRAKVSTSYLSRLENGFIKAPSAAMLERIAAALGVTLADLVDNVKSNDPDLIVDFHMYVSRKFENNPKLQRALIATYEAIEAERQLQEKEARKREAELEEWRRRYEEAQKRIDEQQQED